MEVFSLMLVVLNCFGDEGEAGHGFVHAAVFDFNSFRSLRFGSGFLRTFIIGAFIIGIGDLERDLSGVQLVLGHFPVAGPAFASADGKGGRAEFFDLLAARIIQLDRRGHISISDIGYGDGNGDRLRSGKFIFAQFHGDLDRILRKRSGYAQQNQGDPQCQCKEQAFPVHMVSEPGAPSSFPPTAAAGRVNVDGYRTSIVLYRENIILSIICNN